MRRHRNSLPFLLSWLIVIAMVSAQPQRAPVEIRALTNVELIDGTSTAPRKGMTIVVEGQTIVGVFPSGSEPLPEGATVLDLSGRTVIPGLIDAHIHINQLGSDRDERYAELRRMLYGGVVAAREMAGDLRLVGEASRSTLLGETAGPDIFYSAVMGGPGFVFQDPRGGRASAGLPRGSTGWIQAITEETDLRIAVARAAGTGATGLKIYASLRPSLVEGLVREAHLQGLKVWSHATVFPGRPIEYVRAGVDSTSHLCGLPWQDSDADPSPYEVVSRNNRPRFDAALIDVDGPDIDGLLREMAERGTIFDPTLAGQTRGGPFCPAELMIELARAAARRGVTMVAGTDFVADEDDPYPALHREITALVQHDVLSPLGAIRAATANAARVLGLEQTHGSVEVGKLANLIVLDRSPENDITAIREIGMVMKRGRIFQRSDFR